MRERVAAARRVMAEKRKAVNADGSGDSTDPKRQNVEDGPAEFLFKDFEVVKVLNENSHSKMICVQGRYSGKEDPAVVLLEKTPFDESVAREMLTGEVKVQTNFHNDIYRAAQMFPSSTINGIKTTVIYPATEKHVKKYSSQNIFLIEETAEDYQKITLPYITEASFNIQWVFNILEKKKESERIVFEDEDKENGFILLPDMKWNTEQVEDLYLVGIVHRHGIKSLRDLDDSHLPLLKNIYEKGVDTIKSKYGLGKENLRIYFHYQPSYYHLHVHFTNLKYDAPGSKVERAHLLTEVINNITLKQDYYQKSTLSFTSAASDPLYVKYKEAGHV